MVNQIILHRRIYKRDAAMHQDIPTGLLLQFGYFIGEVLGSF